MNDEEKRFLEQIQKQNEDAHAETRRQMQAMATDFAQAQKQNEDSHTETRRQFAEFAQAIQERFDTKTAEIEQRFDSTTTKIEQRFESTTARIERRFDSTTAAIEQRFDSTTAKIEQRFDEAVRVMRQHFDTVAEDIAEKTHREIQLLAESLAHVDQKVDVNSEKIDRLAADNEVFKAAFANVDRRLRVVEDIVLPQKPS
jgi:hypothetical protein